MKPKINSGDLVTVSSDVSSLKIDDIVLCKVQGRHFLHLIKAITIKKEDTLYLIGNNKNGINGWIGINNIYGKVLTVTS